LLVRAILGSLALAPPFFLWVLARLVFDDAFSLRPRHWLWLLVIEVAGFANAMLQGKAEPWLLYSLGYGYRLLSLGLIVHALWCSWQGRRGDLVEARVRIRALVLSAAGIAAGLVLFGTIFYGPAADRPPVAKFSSAVIAWLLHLTLGAAVLRLDPDLLPPGSQSAPRAPLPMDPADVPSTTTVAPVDPDSSLMARLNVLMRQEEVWRKTGLTVGGLASLVGVPEYRLRRFINQKLGFGNFTMFLNEHRLTAAAARLGDPKQLRTPVLTIALELGWGSIGPFNRAFRDRFGMTPSDHRRKQTEMPIEEQNGLPTL